MAADTTTALLGLLLQGTGNNNNSWGQNLNDSVIQLLENAVAGQATIVSLGGTYTLSAAEARASTLLLSNTLTSDLTIVVPDTAKNYRIVNYNAVNGFWTLLKCSTNATKVSVPCSKATEIVVAGGIPYRSDRAEVGRYVYDAASVNGDAVECDGTLYKRLALPDLFAKIGTTYGTSDSTDFRVPNAYDTGRFLRSRTASVAVATSQMNQNLAHTHTMIGAPTVGSLATASDGAHIHAVFLNDPGHTHSGKVGIPVGTGYAIAQPSGYTIGDIASNTTGITVRDTAGGGGTANQTASSGAHTHTITGAPGLGTIATASSGGTEARPESLVAILCIKY